MKTNLVLGGIILAIMFFIEPICNGLLLFGIWGAVIPFLFLGLVMVVLAVLKMRDGGAE